MTKVYVCYDLIIKKGLETCLSLGEPVSQYEGVDSVPSSIGKNK